MSETISSQPKLGHKTHNDKRLNPSGQQLVDRILQIVRKLRTISEIQLKQGNRQAVLGDFLVCFSHSNLLSLLIQKFSKL